MKGILVNYRISRHVQHPRHMVITVDGIDSKEKAGSVIGKSVSWKTPGKAETYIKGKITHVHGNSGAVRALFERGMPGQAIGAKVEIN